MKLIILLMTLLASVMANAAEKPWLKSKTPNELPVYAEAIDCGNITGERAIEIMSGVLIRSRIKPLKWADNLNKDMLNARIFCFEHGDQKGTYQYILALDYSGHSSSGDYFSAMTTNL